ncbi:MAG: hypothetical protein U1E15_12350 [Hyphomicrobiales bacterium]
MLRSSSSLGAFGALLLLLGVAGCSANAPLMEKLSDLRLATLDEPVPQKAVIVAPDPIPAKGQAVVVPAASTSEHSNWCDYLREDAAAQATIMRSPSLRGSLDNDAKASIALGMSLSDVLKANLTEDAAQVKCQKYLAEAGLQKLVFLSPQGLSAAGYKARFRAIDSQRKEVQRLKNKAHAKMLAGEIDRERATAIAVLADSILADAEAARSQADRRMDVTGGKTDAAGALGAQLLQAEADLEDINSRMRTLDAMDVSASVGWNDDVNNDGFDSSDQAFSGKVNFSVKLGALAPSRFAHEEAARDAKLRAIQSDEGGALWQVAVLRRAHERAIQGLVQQQQQLDAAIAKAGDLARQLASVDNPEFEPPLIQAKLQLIKLKADRAAVAGSIAEIESNRKKLKAG